MLKRAIKYLLHLLPNDLLYRKIQVYLSQRAVKQGAMEDSMRPVLEQLIPAGATALDVGANFGHYTAFLAQQVGKDGQVYAFEPIPTAFKIAQAVTRSYPQVQLYQKGVGVSEEIVAFHLPIDDWKNKSFGLAHLETKKVREEARTIAIKASIVAIDDFLLPQLMRLDFVKIDTEGSEFFVLKGMQKTIERFQPIIYVELVSDFLARYDVRTLDVYQFIRAIDYSLYCYRDECFLPFEGEHFSDNFLLCPKSMQLPNI
ncbi:MAG: FkbM family methyltransferase [Bacteroidota bacterium]